MKRLLTIAAIIATSIASSTMSERACPAQTLSAQQSGAQSGLTAKSAQVDALLAPFSQGNTPGVVVLVPGGYLGYRTNIRRYPGQRTSIIVLSNNAEVVGQALARSIGHIYLGDKMVAPVAQVKVDPTVLSSYAGRYESDSPPAPGLTIDISLENGELYITSAIRPKAKLLAQSPTEFIVSGSTATATFNKGENGNVVGLSLKTRMGVIAARRLPTTNP